MAKRKSKLDKATDIIAEIIAAQLAKLSPSVAAAKRKRLHDLATKVGR
jgi:hypothetical protein